jgi:hypothetical protein
MGFGLAINIDLVPLSLFTSSERGAGWTGKYWAVCVLMVIGLSLHMVDGYWCSMVSG